VEFLVISIFHETKIRMVDMKVQVYSKFRKNFIKKEVKSPNSMRNGRFDTSKCRGKLEKMGVLCTHSPKRRSPFPKLPQKIKIKIKIKDRPTLSRRRPCIGSACPFFFEFFFLLPSTFCTSSQLLLVGSSTCPPCPEFT
jgi:hypothetical protein